MDNENFHLFEPAYYPSYYQRVRAALLHLIDTHWTLMLPLERDALARKSKVPEEEFRAAIEIGLESCRRILISWPQESQVKRIQRLLEEAKANVHELEEMLCSLLYGEEIQALQSNVGDSYSQGLYERMKDKLDVLLSGESEALAKPILRSYKLYFAHISALAVTYENKIRPETASKETPYQLSALLEAQAEKFDKIILWEVISGSTS